jgi:hypothetical protein
MLRFAVEERAGLRSSRAALAQARRELNAAPRFQDSAAAVRKLLDSLASRVLTGDSDAEGWSDLESRVRLAVSRSGAAVNGSTRLPDSVRIGMLQRLTGRTEIESDVRGVVAAIRAVEQNPAVLRVQEIRLEAANPESPVDVQEVLRAELVVQGWFLARPHRSAPQ